VWSPHSEYEPTGAIDDFGYHDEQSVGKNNPDIGMRGIKREALDLSFCRQ
jgi:hypothetical protein